MKAVEVDYELSLPLDQMPAITPFATGVDLIHLLGFFGDMEQPKEVKPRKVEWRLKGADGGSASLRSISEPDIANRAGLTLVRGFNFAEHEEQLPVAWSLEAGRRAAQVATRLGDTQSTGLRLAVTGEESAEAIVTRQTSRHLKSATALRIKTYGSVVGTLGRVTAHRTRQASLWSDLTGRRIDVRFGEGHIEQMRAAWAHAHVEIIGFVYENAAGQVLRVDMDRLEVLDAAKVNLSESLPHGYYPEMSGGMPTVEYLRMIRGDD